MEQGPPSTSENQDRPGAPPQPAWTDERLAEDPHRDAEKADRVQRMFTAIAGSYDLNNRVHSLLLDQRWRRHAVKTAAVRTGDVVVDVACGTGDLTEAFAATPAARVIGVDFTFAMLERARRRQRSLAGAMSGKIAYVEGDAMRLPLADACCDVVSIAFGLRNVQEPARALAEFRRVLRPGGRLVILEFGRPRFPPVRWANDLYTKVIMPRTATWISRDRSGAYKYLPRSIETFLDRPTILAMLGEAGFAETGARSLSGGICACYRAIANGE
ncbi:MAG: bifunctional demethylmenaquinone methyltransferase/2-methoxy-6-polyprenyl-1,4-benzoquinol methylase UbiE [Planctomycetota bacterium]